MNFAISNNCRTSLPMADSNDGVVAFWFHRLVALDYAVGIRAIEGVRKCHRD